ncbi:hypothetical protein [Bifidobacterium leontopitheci]|uniref:ABC transporter permease n=1 Tax=Bifidobacterium leontopitheci TaxID=2650774 RepID=A0A6I1GG21_9BIFI|nr:hypothetical protein [Bifidobacterium leontopitheci]KAB7790584.1 hypothetical protein F7D09_0953 [Bifidobacterium leontopitheci]
MTTQTTWHHTDGGRDGDGDIENDHDGDMVAGDRLLDDVTDGGSPKPGFVSPPGCMRLRGVLSEAGRNLATGASRTALLAALLTLLLALACAADLATMRTLSGQVERYVRAGGSTYVLEASGHVDAAACDALAGTRGVQAAGALRLTDRKLTFSVLPSTGVPLTDISRGAESLFLSGNSFTVRPAPADDGGVLLSREAARSMGVSRGADAALVGGGDVWVSGVFDYPDDGRQSGFSYSALAPAAPSAAFDQCWVRAWPVPDDIESLMLTVVRGTIRADSQRQPSVTQLNVSMGVSLDSRSMFDARMTRFAPLVMLAAGLALGLASVMMRRLELASALHCGVPKPALVAQMLVEAAAWTCCAVLLCGCALAVAVPWMFPPADSVAVWVAMARIGVATLAGVLVGAGAGAAMVKERQLFAFFKNR